MSFINKLFSGILSILITAVILSVFEAIFFFYVVTKDMQDNINNNLVNVVKKSLKNNRFEISNEFTNLFASYFNKDNDKTIKTIKDREQILIDNNNYYTKFNSLVIIFGLVLLTTFFYVNTPKESHSNAIKTALITVFVIILFQIKFYGFGKSYNYLGSYGDDEILNLVFNNLHTY